MNTPIDPQDLLYTNKFINTNLINNAQIKKNIKNYNEFKTNYEKEQKFDDNYLQNANINVNKVNQNHFPSKFKNRYPVFSDSINDIIENKYKKIYKTNLYIYSKDRNKTLHLFPNNYELEVPKLFNNIRKIILKDVYIPNYLTPINETNNVLCWQYLNLDVLNLEKINYNIIPCIKREGFIGIPYSNLKDSYSEVELSKLTNKCFFKYSNPSVEDFNDYVRNETMKNSHNIELESPYNDELLPETMTKSLMRTLFYFDINKESGKVRVINRLEELSILGIQTFGKLSISEIKNYDIYDSYISTKISGSFLNPNAMYILLEYSGNYMNFIQQTQGNPLIITDFPKIDSYSQNIINFTELYNTNLYYDYLSKEEADNNLATISNYKFFDLIEIGKSRFIRLEVFFSSGNSNNNYYIENGKPIIPILPETYIFNKSLQKFFDDGESNTNFRLIHNLHCPKIGRAICFRFVNDSKIINNNIDDFTLTELLSEKLLECNKEIKKSFLIDLFKWDIDDIVYNLETFDYNYLNRKFRFIHCNYQSVEYRLNDTINNLFKNRDYKVYDLLNLYNTEFIQLQKNLNIQKHNDKYYFRVLPFIFIRITFNNNINNDTNNQHMRCVDSKNSQYNNSYIPYFDSLTDNRVFIKKETNEITAKIKLDNLFGGSNDLFYEINEEIIFYEQLYNKLDNVKIEFLTPDGKLVENIFDNSLTLEIYEEKEVLKETLINSKTGIINTNGSNFT